MAQSDASAKADAAAESENPAGMVDITRKSVVFRMATACGCIRLKGSTIEAIRRGQVKKGDVLTTARIAAILAAKDTPRFIPMCHPIPITGLEVNFQIEPDPSMIRAEVTVTSLGRTGVEMEALAGVSAALLNIWDMVKYLEKDGTGNYPETEICEIRVLEKRKEEEEA